MAFVLNITSIKKSLYLKAFLSYGAGTQNQKKV